MVANYIFQVIDEKNEIGYTIYKEEDNKLICSLEDFERWHKLITSLQDLVEYLKSNRINQAISFNPHLENVCSHPYELLSEEDIQACEADGKWYKFNHLSIDDAEIHILRKKGIEVDLLNNKEEKAINKRLKPYEK